MSKEFLGNHQIPTAVKLHIQGNLNDHIHDDDDDDDVTFNAQVAKLCVARWKPWSWTWAFCPTKYSVFHVRTRRGRRRGQTDGFARIHTSTRKQMQAKCNIWSKAELLPERAIYRALESICLWQKTASEYCSYVRKCSISLRKCNITSNRDTTAFPLRKCSSIVCQFLKRMIVFASKCDAPQKMQVLLIKESFQRSEFRRKAALCLKRKFDDQEQPFKKKCIISLSKRCMVS